MTKEVIQISAGVLAGALSRGATGTMLEKSSNTVKTAVSGALCIGMGFAATKVKGTDTKANMLRGAAMGVSVAQGLELIKGIFSNEKIAAKLSSESASGRFIQKASGLSGGVNGLNGYTDEFGNYHEDGLGGMIAADGTFIDEDGLSGVDFEDEFGLNGFDDDEYGLNGFDEDEDGLNGVEFEEFDFA